jgi:drug/metabolite transporter (DMT)-like permease
MHSLMFVATLCWAANIVAAKEALRGFAPLALVQLRVLGAALIFAILFVIFRNKISVKLIRGQWRSLIVLALTGVTFNQFFFVSGVARSTVAHTGLITALGPVMVLVLACLMRLEALTATKFVGMLVSFAGVAVLTIHRSGGGSVPYWTGDLLLLAASAVFAVYTIQAKRVANQYNALTLNTLLYGLGSIMMLLFGARSVLLTHWSAIHSREAWAVVYVIVFGSVVPYTIYLFVMTDLAASRVAAFSYLQPVIATTLAVWLLSERLAWRVAIGGALILAGVYLTGRERGDDEPPDPGSRDAA